MTRPLFKVAWIAATVACAVCDGSSVQSQPAPPPRRGVAVVAGVNHYGPGIAPLKSSVSDARSTGRALSKLRIEVRYYVDQGATRAKLIQALKAAQADLRGGEFLVLYFAGHGDVVDGVFRLLTADAQLDRLAQTTISVDELRSLLRDIGLHQCLVIADTCYAGELLTLCQPEPGSKASPAAAHAPAPLNGTARAIRRLPAARRTLVVLAAAHTDELAREDRAGGRFTAALLVVLHGGSPLAPPDGVFRPWLLFAAVDAEFHRRWPQEPQRPTFTTCGPGEFELPTPRPST